MILNALAGKPLPVYGDGRNVRDWLYVERSLQRDAARARGRAPGRDLQHRRQRARRPISTWCNASATSLDDLRPTDGITAVRSTSITFVKDRPGHDRRYAIDAAKIERELGWRPAESFETGLRKTVRLVSRQSATGWPASVQTGDYRGLGRTQLQQSG